MSSTIIAQPKELIAAFVNVRQGHAVNASWGVCNTLGLIRNDRLVAGIVYNDYSGMNAYMHIGAEPGCRWMTRNFLFAAFDYPFNQLQMKRVTALVRSNNKTALEFVQNLGFDLEGRMRSFFKNADALIYGMTREECRFLNELRKAA